MSKKSADEGEEWRLPTVDETIARLRANSFQYASAGDVKRLVDEIDRLRRSAAMDELVRDGQMMWV